MILLRVMTIYSYEKHRLCRCITPRMLRSGQLKRWLEIVIPEVRGIDTDIVLTIKDDILSEKLLNVILLIAKHREHLNSVAVHYRSDYSLPDYEAFYSDDDHIKEKSSGSTTTHANFSQYDSFIFDLSINLFPALPDIIMRIARIVMTLVLAVLSSDHSSFTSSASFWESDILILSTNVLSFGTPNKRP
ncbi:hypothetical protein Tco_0524208 [Tanacetum coccineum]